MSEKSEKEKQAPSQPPLLPPHPPLEDPKVPSDVVKAVRKDSEKRGTAGEAANGTESSEEPPR